MTWFGENTRSYLQQPARLAPITLLLLPVTIYILGASADLVVPFVLLIVLGAMLFFAPPRWQVYLVVGLALVVLLSIFVLSSSIGPQDARSNRDDQVEIAARYLLAGENPWSHPLNTGNPISSGPSGILLSIPFVLLFDRINELTLVFYLIFFAVLLAGDLRCRNDSFPLLALLLMSGAYGFQHTLGMSLEELFFWYLFLAWAFWLVESGRPLWAGVCLAVAFCGRPSYAFPVLAFVGWYVYSRHFSRTGLFRMAAGGAAGVALLLVPFVAVGGAGLLQQNPVSYGMSLMAGNLTDSNLVFRVANALLFPLGGSVANTILVVIAVSVIAFASHRWARLAPQHPFWHLCLGGFVANMVAYLPNVLVDYVLFFVVPAMMAVAFSAREIDPGRAQSS